MRFLFFLEMKVGALWRSVAPPFAMVPIEESGAVAAVGFMIDSLFSGYKTSLLNPIKANTECNEVKRKAGLMLPNARNPSFPNHLTKEMFFVFENESQCAVAVCSPAIRYGPDRRIGSRRCCRVYD